MSHMQNAIRIKVDVELSLVVEPKLHRIVYVVIRPPLPGQDIRSMFDLATYEIPMNQIVDIPLLWEGDFVHPHLMADIYCALQTEAEDYLLNKLDQVLDLSILPLESLLAIRAEYDEMNYWDSIPEEHFDPKFFAPIYAIIEKLDKLLSERGGIDLRERMIQQAKPTDRSGYVYLIRSKSGYWKIGKTIDPVNRIKTFGVKLPFEIEYEHLIRTSHMNEAERVLHDHFADKRVNGEWFDLDETDIAYIKSIDSLTL